MKEQLVEGIRKAGGCIAFIISGLVAIIVGSFMLRGTMHLWDDPSKSEQEDEKPD